MSKDKPDEIKECGICKIMWINGKRWDLGTLSCDIHFASKKKKEDD